MTLKDLEIGESARITIVGGEGALRQHFWIWVWCPELRSS